MYYGLTAYWFSRIEKERRISKVDCGDIGESIINGLSSSCLIILITLSFVVVPVTIVLDIFSIGVFLLCLAFLLYYILVNLICYLITHIISVIWTTCLRVLNSVMINPYLRLLEEKEK